MSSAKKIRIYHRLQLAAHRIQKVADRTLLEATGVTTAQAGVLIVVAAAAAVTQRGIARQLGLNESAVTPMMARLVGMGLLKRERDDTDARAWRLYLSEAGSVVVKNIDKPFRKINAAIESVLTPDEVERLGDYLGRIGKAFEGK